MPANAQNRGRHESNRRRRGTSRTQQPLHRIGTNARLTVPEGVVWAILLLPVGSLLTIAFLTKPYPRLSGYVTIAAIGTAFAVLAVDARRGHRYRRPALAFGFVHWLTIGTDNPVLQAARRAEPEITSAFASTGSARSCSSS